MDAKMTLTGWSAALVLVFLSGSGSAPSRAERGPTVALHDTGRGSLLIKTDVAGRFQEAPLLQTDVRMRITGLIARVVVTQRFANPTEEWREGVYVFPLPEQAAVDAMRMRVGERVIEGQIKERQQAQQTYQAAKREGKKASLLEQERPNIFSLSVANLGPKEEVEVELEYQEILRYDQGQFRLRFPLVVGPRYIPGCTQIDGFSGEGWARNTPQVPDAERITPPVLHPDEGLINPVSLSVDLEAGFPLRRLESSFHPVVTIETAPFRHQVTLRDKTVPADRDFELVWAPGAGTEPKAALFTEKREGETYGLVMVIPPDAGVSGVKRLPRETLIIVDTSGSMAGASIEQAKLALEQALSALQPEDSFNLIQFNSYTEKLFPLSVPAGGRELELARRYVQGLRANGGTEMLPALRAGLEGEVPSGRLRQVIFITDGNVGNEAELFGYIQSNLRRSRLFTVGIGSAPNSHFMNKAAQFGRGTYAYIGSPNEVAEKMGDLFRKIESPVLTDITPSWSASGVEAWPDRVPDLYLGEPVILLARFSGDLGGGLQVSGNRGNQPWVVDLKLLGGSEEKGIGKLWARKKISRLMDSVIEGADREQVRLAVIDLALKHHLVSAYTSLVAVDVTPSRPEGTPGRTAAVPTNLPAGWRYESVFGSLPKGATPASLYLALGLAFLLLAVCLRKPAEGRG
jgi:Ca-activated chloride channel family protein